MLLGGKSDSGVNESFGNDQNVDMGAAEDQNIESPSEEAEEQIPGVPGVQDKEQQQQQQTPNASPKTEELLQAALKAQQNQQLGLKSQIQALEAAIAELKGMKTSIYGSSATPQSRKANAIELTVEYPGEAADVISQTPTEHSSVDAEAASMKSEGGLEESSVINPATLHVPLIVVAPIRENYHDILLKTMKEAEKANKHAAVLESIQTEVQR